MKLLFLTVILVCVSFFSLAQNGHDNCRLDTILNYNYQPFTSIRQLSGREIFQYDQKDSLVHHEVHSYVASNWVNYYRYQYSYDANGNLTEESFQNSDQFGNVWINNNRTKYIYNGLNQLLEISEQDWDNNADEWLTEYHVQFSYDLNGNLIQIYHESYDISTGFIAAEYKLSSTYDASNNAILDIYFIKNMSTNTWDNSSRSQKTYDAQNNKLSELYENWDETNSSWINSYRISNTYGAFNKVSMYSYETWDFSGGFWQKSTRNFYKYNNKGLPIEEISQGGYNGNNTWENHSRSLMNYDNQGNLILGIVQNATSSGGWWDETRVNMTYTSNNILIEKIREDWNYGQQVWNNNYKEINTFGANDLPVKFERFLGSSFNPDWHIFREEHFEYDSNNVLIAHENHDNWNSSYQDFQYKIRQEYSCKYSGSNTSSGFYNATIYPNPVTKGDNLIVRSDKDQDFQLIDYFGRIVKKERLEAGENIISTTNLKNGLYLLKLESKTYKIAVK